MDGDHFDLWMDRWAHCKKNSGFVQIEEKAEEEIIMIYKKGQICVYSLLLIFFYFFLLFVYLAKKLLGIQKLTQEN